MLTTKMGNDKCPHCGAPCTCATGAIEEAVPKPGDLSVCFKCGGFLQYSRDMALQKLPMVVFETLDRQTKRTLLKMQYLIRTPQS